MFDNQIKKFQAWESELAEKSPAWYLLWVRFKKLVGLVSLTIIPIWIAGVYSNWKWGWFVTGLYWLAIIVFVIVFAVALKKTEKRGFLFWQPWFLAFALGIIFVLHESNILPFHPFIPAPQAKYETSFTERIDNNFELNVEAEKAFLAGDYAYSAMLNEQAEKNAKGDPNPSWQANRTLLAAAKLGQNPTSQGYMQFSNQLVGIVAQVQQQLKDGKRQIFGMDAKQVLIDIKKKLRQVKKQLPVQETAVIDETIAQLQKIQDELQ